MREYKRIFNDDNVSEEKVEIKAKKLVNKAQGNDPYDFNDKEIYFSDIDNSYDQDRMYGKYDTNLPSKKDADVDYVPPFTSGEIEEKIPEEIPVPESLENAPDDLDYIDSDAIRFNDISNSQRPADALDLDEKKDAAEYIPMNEETKAEANYDANQDKGKYFIDKEITLSKKDTDDSDKEDKIHLLSELDGPSIEDDISYEDDFADEEYDEDAIVFTDIENDENGNSLIYNDSVEDENYDDGTYELDDDYDNLDDSYESDDEYDDESEYPELDEEEYYEQEDDSQVLFENLGDDTEEQDEFEDGVAESAEAVENDLEYDEEYTEDYDAEDDVDETEFFLDDLSVEDEEEVVEPDLPEYDDKSIDAEPDAISDEDEDMLFDNLDLANDKGDDDSFSSLDLEDDIDNQNDMYKSEPGKPRGKRNAVILIIVCIIAVVLGFGLYFLINYFSNSDFKGFSDLFSAENVIEEDIDLRV